MHWVASAQLSRKPPNRSRAAGPSTRTWVSRQWPGSSQLPVHSSAMPTPPVKPTRPSTTRILRWVRLFSLCRVYQRVGRNQATLAPASSSRSISERSILAAPTASSSTLTSTPASARSARASANSGAMLPVQYT